ncbi:MAG TPA: 2-amino-4-hydroxy-6-hydroxymethyldihydropteridine diphosphokinase [bacterium]|jgi:2-amino-4-hydroxy-6-hydroxymethyldihydropteridine diphosphokinase
MSLEIFVGLGSNLGDREAFLRLALSRMGGSGRIRRTSSIYESQPWGREDQPDFLNAVCAVEPNLADPEGFFRELKQIENDAGRSTHERWGPRELDLDLLFWGGDVIATEILSVPHPRLAERRFVLIPLFEIAPDLTHTITGLTVRQMLESCADPGRVRLWGRFSP